MDDNILQENSKDNSVFGRPKYRIIFMTAAVFIVLLFLGIAILSPRNSEKTMIHISQGESLRSITLKLEEQKIIRQAPLLQSLVIFLKNDRQIAKGDYLFDKGVNVWKVAWMLTRGEHNVIPVKITLPEGATNEEIADILIKKMPNFNQNAFLEKIKGKRGYLFPDTYFFFPLTTQDEIISELSSNFDNKINSLTDSIKNSKYSLSQIITMASIIEGEANGPEDISIISGILWKRLEKGIPLQVDVAKETYVKKGLPENPISNPGLLAIKASLNPTYTKYLYYLHDKDGIIHYAVTYTEHKRNIAKYLK